MIKIVSLLALVSAAFANIQVSRTVRQYGSCLRFRLQIVLSFGVAQQYQ